MAVMKIIPGWLRQNVRIKLGMFMLAVMLWFFVATQRNYERIISVPVKITGMKKNRVITSEVPDRVDVKFQASGRELIRMRFVEEPYLSINLSTIFYYYTFRITPDMIVIPGGLRVIPLDVVQPDSISVMLKEKAEAVLPVTPQLRVNTDAGYILATKPTTIPAQVRVIGPKDQLDELETIKTVFAQVDEARKSGEVVLDLAAPAPYGYRFLPEQVRVIYQVERLTEREFKNVQVSADHVPQGRRLLLEPQTVAISAVGSVTALAALKAANITAWVDYEECNQVSGRATVHIRLPEGISTKRLVPSEVKVMVRRE